MNINKKHIFAKIILVLRIECINEYEYKTYEYNYYDMRKTIIYLFLNVLVALWLCNINPVVSYSWISGIWHGLFFLPNFILSLFTNHIYKAVIYGSAYNLFWWIATIFSTISSLIYIFDSITHRRPDNY